MLASERSRRAGLASARAPCPRRGRAAGRARRPPGARSTRSRPRFGRRGGGRLVSEHRDRERGVVARADPMLERDPVERAADRRLEEGEPARDERDARRIRADAGERVAVVAADGHRMAGDPGRLGRESLLRLASGARRRPTASRRCGRRGRRRRRGRPRSRARGSPAAAIDAVAAGPRPDEHRLALLVDRLDPAEVGVVGARQSARGRGRLDAVPPLEDPADDELDLRRGEDREREPERDRRLQPVREAATARRSRAPRRGRQTGRGPARSPGQQGRGSVGSRA